MTDQPPLDFGQQIVAANVGMLPGEHCFGCGSELVRDAKPFMHAYKDGSPKYAYHCPNRRWWNGSNHTMGLA
jgi:hypothetical protein